MSNPVLVDVYRGRLVESLHRGSVAVVDADRNSLLSLGDIIAPVFPRSAVKALQALPLIESGTATRFGFGNRELALACASHGGEPEHISLASGMLERAGCECAALSCGAHWPMHEPSALALARSGGSPSALHNACSGKHIGFICLAQTLGVDHHGYASVDHSVQKEVRSTIENLAGVSLSTNDCGIDGCSVPTWALPLRDLALAFARFGTGHGLGPERAKAAALLRAACAAEPWYVAGTGRFCTKLMQLLGERAFVKFGAEGVYCAAIPEHGLGIAIKCDDGAVRAAEVTMATLIARFLTLDSSTSAALATLIKPTIKNWSGQNVGWMQPADTIR